MNVGPDGGESSHSYRETHRQPKLVVGFLNFAKAPAKESFIQSMSNRFIL